jgi:hypothetical protein
MIEALDGLATFAKRDGRLMTEVRRALRAFERSGSKALAARAADIRRRLETGPPRPAFRRR